MVKHCKGVKKLNAAAITQLGVPILPANQREAVAEESYTLLGNARANADPTVAEVMQRRKAAKQRRAKNRDKAKKKFGPKPHQQ